MRSRSLLATLLVAMLALASVAAPAVAQPYPPPPPPGDEEPDDETDVGGEVSEFAVESPIPGCVLDIPVLIVSTELTSQTIGVRFVDLSGDAAADAPDLGPYTGQSIDGDAVAGTVRAQVTVQLPDTPNVPVEVRWPGVVVEDGEPVAWPGWVPDIAADGTLLGWDPVSDGFGWARTDDPSQLGVVFDTGEGTTPLFGVTYPDPPRDCADVGVEDDVDEREDDPADVGDDDAEIIASPERQQPLQVLGRLPRTGGDALVIAAVGLLLVGLGVLSVRRTRPSTSR